MNTIVLEPDGRGSFTFTFSSPRGEMSGRVNVGTEGPPDRRSTADKEQAAKNQILALARELASLGLASADPPRPRLDQRHNPSDRGLDRTPDHRSIPLG